ncbi:hypothetical protein NE172_18205 [Clostridium botulinum]|uniref:Uncharacterized protein n=1 Tax=Clostridium botulinum TaxID=1491 RepID=A0A6B4JS76_CLOBO|nr:hypothetical protein [Clostridium botulinum]EES50769.1 hypothetical protein CLO_1557 [Clostridium botulinum E1 str. 'BoNT E Beluga']MBY6762850.1 hypothetical protein [Clostridium botulinum]MBY6921634.1 hypothetical protein [Clostridium botulinum]MCR1132836.1 hypothetical protein [Clostridium botulinum]NFH70782.1 hypothetical protein [Clostridium botulinum]
MSKFLVSLSYKDCCILKHALRDMCELKDSLIIEMKSEGCSEEEVEKEKQELQEEKRTLERFTEEIETIKENHHMKVR